MPIKLPDSLELINQKPFVDMPASEPALRMALQHVGINNRPHYIRILDPFDGSEKQLWTEVSVTFALPVNRRGIHMSRIEETLHQLQDEPTVSFSEYAEKVFAKLSLLQELPAACLKLDSRYEKIIDKNRSGKISAELITLHCEINQNKGENRKTLGISVPFVNACPCTQRWAVRDYYNHLKQHEYADEEIRFLLDAAPKQAHTNRGTATLKLESDKVTIAEIYEVLDRSVPIIRELLKGSDEHDLVKRTQQDGMFCEDNIRCVIANTIEGFATKLPAETIAKIEIEVDESVHHHNLQAQVSDTLGNLHEGWER